MCVKSRKRHTATPHTGVGCVTRCGSFVVGGGDLDVDLHPEHPRSTKKMGTQASPFRFGGGEAFRHDREKTLLFSFVAESRRMRPRARTLRPRVRPLFRAMYGWERRNGALADHFAETITDDDVVRTLERTRRALVPEAKPPAESHIESVAPSEVVQVDDATPLQIAPVTPTQQGSDIPVDCIRTASADQRVTHQTNWPDMKLAGTEAFGRGSYHAAAVHFCSAIAVVEKAPAPLPERHTEILAGLHSNHSAALLLSGDSFGALRAAEQCVATRPGWEKAHFRKGEALFASRRFAEARTAYADAIDAERASTANTENTAQGNTNESTFHCPSLLTLRLAAASRAATDASVLDHQETALRDARAAAVTESEGKKEATSDANINKLNAEAEDRERDPRARALMKDIEKLFLDARAEMKEEKGETGKEREDTEKEKKFDEEKNDTDETRAGTNAVRDDAPAETAPEEESTKNGKKTFGKKPKGPNARVALSLLNALLSIEPENADASFQAAMLSLRDGDVIGAVTYGRMVRIGPFQSYRPSVTG